MARKVFGGDDVNIRGAARTAWLSAAGFTALVYSDSGATTLADLLTYPGGVAISGSSLTVDSNSQLPLFQGPNDGSDTLYVKVNGGPASAIYARIDDRLDALETFMITTVPATYEQRRTFNVMDYGAVGDDTTIPGSALAAAQEQSGQEWLTTSDTLDTLAYFKAQAAADAAGGGIVEMPDLGGDALIGRDYQLTAPLIVHSNIHVVLNGSVLPLDDGTRFTTSDRAFLFGMLTRQDYPRFAAQGWQYTADNVAQGARTLTNVSGGSYAVGDVVLIRSTAEDATIPASPIPTVSTFNVVSSFSGGTLTLYFPMEQAVTAPLIINFDAIETLKSDLVATGLPHRYYCALNASLTGTGVVKGQNQDSPPVNFLAAHGLNIDMRIEAPQAQLVYGGGLTRSHVKAWGRFGGLKNAIELGTGSALNTIEVDGEWSGIVPGAGTMTDYNLILVGEQSFKNKIKGRLRSYGQVRGFGIRDGSLNNQYEVDIESEGIASAAVVFDGTGARVKGRIKCSSANYWLDYKTANGNNVATVDFEGTPVNAVRFRDDNNGIALNCNFPSGSATYSGALGVGSSILGGYLATAPATPGSNLVSTMTALGPYSNPRTLSPRGQVASTKSGVYGFLGLAVTTSVTLGNGNERAIALFFPEPCTLSKIGLEVTSAGGDSGALVRLGIRADNGHGYPGTLILDAGTIDGSSATIQEIAISQAVYGLVWITATVQGVVTTQPTVRAVSSAINAIAGASSNTSSPNGQFGFTQSGVTGPLAAFSSTITASGSMARVFWKIA